VLKKSIKRKPLKIAKRKSKTTTRRLISGKRIKSKLRIVLLSFISVLITVIILLGYSFYKFINAPFTSASGYISEEKDTVWVGNTTILLIKIEDLKNSYSNIESIQIIDFDNNQKQYSIFHIPVEYELDYPLNYGRGPLSKLYAVGNSDNDRGVYLTEKTILNLLAIQIDGYIITDNKSEGAFKGLYGDIDEKNLSELFRIKNTFKTPEAVNLFRQHTLTSLKLTDLFDFYIFIKNTSETSSKVIKIESNQLSDNYKWDRIWQDHLKFTDIKREGVKVFIANASEDETPGLASWGSRIVQNLGLEVFSVKNSTKILEENTIIVSTLDSESGQKLASTLGIKNILLKDEVADISSYNPEVLRADVSLLLVKF
jgi:hypothetical protein